MKGRTLAGIAIVAAWGGGMGVLVQHEYFRPRIERLNEAATRIAPATLYYTAMQGDRQVGFASSTIDTANTTVTENDYFVVEVPSGSAMRRTTSRTNVTLSRSLHLTQFNLSLEAAAPAEMTGRVDGDSVLVVRSSASRKWEMSRVPFAEPLLLPTLVPLVVGLAEKPSIGKRYVLPVFDPTTKTAMHVGYTIRAESLFVVADSAVLDSTVSPPVWRGTRPDTVRAWEVTPDSGVTIGFSGWVDEQGRIVATSQLGFTLRRQPYELAFRNWQNDPSAHAADAGIVVPMTALAAGKTPKAHLDSMTILLDNVDPKLKLRLAGVGQRVLRDTVFVAMAPDTLLASAAPLRPLPNSAIWRQAVAIAGENPERAVAAQRLLAWVHDSIHARVPTGAPTAMEVLQTRAGDCNEFAEVFVALARSRGLPARLVTGLLYVDGKFYYHVWAELQLKDWVPVDPMLGQFPADAAHLRLMQGFALRNDVTHRLTGIDVRVVSAKDSPRKPTDMSHR